MKVKIKYLQSGESPDLGAFKEGDDGTMEKDTAELLEKRGVVEIVPAVKSAIRNPKSAIERED